MLCHNTGRSTEGQTDRWPHSSMLRGQHCVSSCLRCLRPSLLNRTERKDVCCLYCPPWAAALVQAWPAGNAKVVLRIWKVYSAVVHRCLSLQIEKTKQRWYTKSRKGFIFFCKICFSFNKRTQTSDNSLSESSHSRTSAKIGISGQ